MKATLIRIAAVLAIALSATPTWAQSAAATRAQAMLSRIGQATYVAEGRGSRVLYIFFDPNCPYCHHLYQDLRPWVGKAGLQFRWIPVGMLMASSEPKAAAILQSPDPLKAFRQNEDDYDFAADGKPGGGIAPAAHISPKVRSELQANRALMLSGRVYGVPAMLFRDRQGQAQLLAGAPASASELKVLLQQVR